MTFKRLVAGLPKKWVEAGFKICIVRRWRFIAEILALQVGKTYPKLNYIMLSESWLHYHNNVSFSTV